MSRLVLLVPRSSYYICYNYVRRKGVEEEFGSSSLPSWQSAHGSPPSSVIAWAPLGNSSLEQLCRSFYQSQECFLCPFWGICWKDRNIPNDPNIAAKVEDGKNRQEKKENNDFNVWLSTSASVKLFSLMWSILIYFSEYEVGNCYNSSIKLHTCNNIAIGIKTPLINSMQTIIEALRI